MLLNLSVNQTEKWWEVKNFRSESGGEHLVRPEKMVGIWESYGGKLGNLGERPKKPPF